MRLFCFTPSGVDIKQGRLTSQSLTKVRFVLTNYVGLAASDSRPINATSGARRGMLKFALAVKVSDQAQARM